MKRIFYFSMAVLFVSLTACSGNSTKTDPAANKDSATGSPDTVASTVSKPEHLDETAFAKKVFDFSKGGKWAYAGDKPCIIDFYADWCRPCRMIAPYMEEFAAEYSGKIYVYKVNTDHSPNLSTYFNIQSIPAVMFCPMNGDPTMTIGANPKEEYERLINELLLK